MNKFVDCIILGRTLQYLQTQCNDGRGLNCIDTVIMYLNANDFHTAKVVINNEWDKISGYPIIADYILSNF